MAKRVTKIVPRPEVAAKQLTETTDHVSAPIPVSKPGRIVLEDHVLTQVNSAPSMKMRRVKAAELQAPTRFPTGNQQTNLHRVPNIEMHWVYGEGLLCKTPSPTIPGGFDESIIPPAACKIVTFA